MSPTNAKVGRRSNSKPRTGNKPALYPVPNRQGDGELQDRGTSEAPGDQLVAEVAAERDALLDESKWVVIKLGWFYHTQVSEDLIMPGAETPDDAMRIARERLQAILG